uniref:Uncharacterized protein n=1 Tax=Heterorhabditis bacteriophora TaxID=37862 RepID=A0A1I7WS12_HETBA
MTGGASAAPDAMPPPKPTSAPGGPGTPIITHVSGNIQRIVTAGTEDATPPCDAPASKATGVLKATGAFTGVKKTRAAKRTADTQYASTAKIPGILTKLLKASS